MAELTEFQRLAEARRSLTAAMQNLRNMEAQHGHKSEKMALRRTILYMSWTNLEAQQAESNLNAYVEAVGPAHVNEQEVHNITLRASLDMFVHCTQIWPDGAQLGEDTRLMHALYQASEEVGALLEAEASRKSGQQRGGFSDN